MTMTGKPRTPPSEQQPDETPPPGQQLQDDGSQNSADSFANMQDEDGENFANINP